MGASKNSVPLMMTRWAGVLTPHASVLVATRTCTRANALWLDPDALQPSHNSQQQGSAPRHFPIHTLGSQQQGLPPGLLGPHLDRSQHQTM